MRKLQIILVIVLTMMLMVSPVIAEQPTINLVGNIMPATIDIGIDKSQLIFDMDAGVESATDSLNITSTSIIPVVVRVTEIEHNDDSWSPEMVVGDISDFTLAEAQSKAKLTMDILTGAVEGTLDYTKLAPVGSKGSISLMTTSNGTDWIPAEEDGVIIGTIQASSGEEGEGNVATYSAKLELNKKRLLSKVLDSDMVLDFSVE